MQFNTATALPYSPPQAPPATGDNTFTDPSGKVWYSQSGSKWADPRDVLHSRVWRAAAWQIPTGFINVTYDTVGIDKMHMWDGATALYARIAGWYNIWAIIAGNASQPYYYDLQAMQSGTRIAFLTVNGILSPSQAWSGALHSQNIYFSAFQYYQIQAAGQASPSPIVGGTGPDLCAMGMSYLGSG